jgi:YbbR domain-containing protein
VRKWILDNWKLKLLAVVLAAGLLLAVAFQQNPITNRSVNANVTYVNLASNLMLIDFPRSIPVTLLGTSTAISAVQATGVTLRADLKGLGPGRHDVTAHATLPSGSGVTTLQNQFTPAVTIDNRVDVNLPITARVTYGPGWQQVPDKPAKVSPGTVSISAPASFVGQSGTPDAVQAFVVVTDPIQSNTVDLGNLPIQFEKGGKTVAFPAEKTLPVSGYTPPNVTVHVDAQKPNVTRETTLIETPSGTPAPGFRVSAVSINPLFVKVTGPANTLASLDTIDLGAIDVTGRSQSFSQRINVGGVLPAVVSSDTAFATVTITIVQNPAVHPSPPPSPSPSSSP